MRRVRIDSFTLHGSIEELNIGRRIRRVIDVKKPSILTSFLERWAGDYKNIPIPTHKLSKHLSESSLKFWTT